MARKLAWCAALLAVSILSPPARAQWAEWWFREGDDFTEGLVCVVPQAPNELPFAGDIYGCENDEARSVKLVNIPAGAMLTVFDDGGCGHHDDYTRIRVLQNTSELIINSFESTYPPYPPSIVFQPNLKNGLDGKVSCIQISLCGDSLCSPGEDYYLCPADCPSSGGGGGVVGGGGGGGPWGADCGNGVCDSRGGESYNTCPEDCEEGILVE